MRQLIINADDFGYDEPVTRGIAEAMMKGIVSSTTMMVNAPGTEGAARLVATLPPSCGVGLHFNLARFTAVSDGRVLVEAAAPQLLADDVERECLAQLDRLESLIGRAATHVDVHKHLHRLPSVLEGLLAAAQKRALPVRSLDAEMRARCRAAGVPTNDHFIGDAGADAYWTMAQLEQSLSSLPADGVVELMCHPGYRPVISSGYSTQREVELVTLTAPAAASALALRNLTPVTWRTCFRASTPPGTNGAGRHHSSD